MLGSYKYGCQLELISGREKEYARVQESGVVAPVVCTVRTVNGIKESVE
jgi:hypothetical protein